MSQYSVQFVVIREVVVDSHNDILAEKDAYAKLKHYDRDNVVAIKVLEDSDREGALRGDLYEAWKFAKAHFLSIDVESLTDVD